MKYLKLFESIENINEICKKYNIKNYTINSDGSIDIEGSVNLSYKNLTELPLKFRNIYGGFYCAHNKLTSLEGSPIHVGSSFYCDDNKITSLEGGPTHVGNSFYCSNNNLTSLEGGPTHVVNNFYCIRNKITSFEGFPSHIGGIFNCVNNPVYEVLILFRDKSKVELFNDYDIIRGKDIVLDRLNDFLITIGNPPVKSVKGYNNI